MKSLKLYLESVIDNDDVYLKSIIDNDDVYFESLLDDDDIFFDPENDKKVIEEWIMKHYTITGRLIITNDFEASCTGRVSVNDKSITSLTNGMFKWGEISSSFICSRCI